MFLVKIYRRAVVVMLALVLCIPSCSKADDHYAAQNGQLPAGPYTEWTSAASNIQDAVNAANTNDTVWVGAGRYRVPTNAVFYTTTNVVYIDKPLTLRSSNGVPASTIIDGEGKCRGIAWNYAVASTSRFMLDGFTVSNCYATNNGGEIYIVPNVWTATVQNCVISDNTALCSTSTAYGNGGGICAASSLGFGIIVSNCVIRNNISTNTAAGQMTYAGGMYLYSGGNKLITGCLIESNRSGAYGGGMYLLSSDMLMENSIIRGNRNELGDNNTGGGGMHLSSGVITLRNCLIYNNYASYGGGILKFANVATPETCGMLAILNCTIVSNIPYAIAVRRLDRLNFSNSIIYTNNIYCLAGTLLLYATNTWIYANGITNGVNGVGNITNGVDPGFINSAVHDYRLTKFSPCFNTGINQDWMNNAIDLDGRKRLRYGTVDMGAYELIFDGSIYILH